MCGFTIQYSRTPAVRYLKSLIPYSFCGLDGKVISIIQSGAPLQPFSVNLFLSQITESPAQYSFGHLHSGIRKMAPDRLRSCLFCYGYSFRSSSPTGGKVFDGCGLAEPSYTSDRQSVPPAVRLQAGPLQSDEMIMRNYQCVNNILSDIIWYKIHSLF